MAIATTLPITHSCGHTATRDLSHVPAGRRKTHAFGISKHQVCPKCLKSQKSQDLEKRNRAVLAEAAGFEEEHALPELTGSEKQVSWATRVRYQVLSEIQDADEHPEDQDTAEQTIQAAKALTRAGWWLDNTTDKDLDVDDLIELITTALDPAEDQPIESENPF